MCKSKVEREGVVLIVKVIVREKEKERVKIKVIVRKDNKGCYKRIIVIVRVRGREREREVKGVVGKEVVKRGRKRVVEERSKGED